MEISQLKELAEKAQLDISDEEIKFFRQGFAQLTKPLNNFRQLKFNHLSPSPQIIKEALSLKELWSISRNHQNQSISQKVFQHNSIVSVKNLVVLNLRKTS